MLFISNLKKVYQSKAVPVTALRSVSLTFADTGLVFILGKSGSGKSTLLHILGGLDTPTAGEVVVDGKPMRGFKERELDDYRNAYVGFVFQEYNLLERESVGKNVALALELQGGQEDRAKIEKVLRQVDLAEGGQTLYERSVRELSGGQRQRVAIARALVKDPKVILADEPTGALDSKTGKQLYELLKALSKERLVVVVTHDEASAKAYGDRIIELADGEVVSDTSPAGEEQGEEHKAAPSGRVPLRGKGGLPFRRVLAMGADGLCHKRLRLAVSILLSAVAFYIFGFCVVASTVDPWKTEFNTLYENGYSMIQLTSDVTREVAGGSETVPYTQEQLNLISDYTGGVLMPYVNGSMWELLSSDFTDYLGDRDMDYLGLSQQSYYYNTALSSLWKFIEINPDTGEEDANLHPDDRFVDSSLCRLPQANDEIAITDIRASMFIEFGYLAEDGTSIAIHTPDDLIGKKLGSMTICGVYSTEIDRHYFEEAKEVYTYSSEAEYILVPGMIRDGFVRQGFSKEVFGEDEIVSMLLRLSGDVQKDLTLMNDLCKAAGQDEAVSIYSVYDNYMGNASFFETVLLIPAQIAAVAFCIFAVLLQMNFLTVSLERKKKEFGILRALGARKKDIAGICIVESFLITAIGFILSAIAVAITCVVLNRIYRIVMFIFGWLPIVALIVLCFGVAALSAILPAVRIGKQKPIDVIRSIE